MRDGAKDRSTMSEDDDDDTTNPTTNHHKWAPNLSSAGGSTKLRPEPGLGPIGSDSPPPFSDQILEIVLENVLQFLTSRFDRNSASLVCKSWYRAEAQARHELFIGNCYAVAPRRAVERFRRVVSVVLKGKPRFADFNLVPFDWGAHVGPWISAFAQGYRWLEKLCVKRMSITDSDLKVIALSMPNFKELVIICSDGFGTEGIAAIAENCKQLRVLNLIDDYLEDDEEQKADWVSMFPQTVTCLETLVFECVGCAVNFDELEALVARSPKLQQLRVNQPVSAEQLRRLMVRAPQLTQLGTGSFRSVAAGDGIDNELNDLVSAFAASKKIVSLSGFRDLSLELLPAIFPVCANLTSLNFSFCEITSEHLRPVIDHCHNLQKFWALDTVHDEGLQMVAATCKDLRELRVFPLDPREDSEGAVSNIGLTAIAEGCLKLRSILYFCQQMTNAAVITMSMNCKDLQVFRLCIMGRHRPDHVTGEPMDEGFGAIVINCKKLTRLAVSGLLTDKAFCYIGKYGKLVRTLSVAFAGNSDLALTYVLQGCHKLQKLEIRDSPFGDSSLLSGIHHYYNMRFLWMSACRLTLRGCKEVAQRLPRMVLEAISDEGEVVDGDDEVVEKLYMYRSLAGPRNDAPPYVKIL